MAAIRTLPWRKLPVGLTELCLDTTLRCGQSFRWRKFEDTWSCALHGRILSLRQENDALHYSSIFPESAQIPPTPPSSSAPSVTDENDDTEALVHHYLNLDSNLTELYEHWSSRDTNFRKRAPKFTGIRILRQDAWEALVGFICSSNNNIIRISQMMEKLCTHYGPLIGYIDDKPYHDMPSPSALIKPGVEAHLRQLGFGYRARYIAETAVMVSQENEEGWLNSLRNPESPVLGAHASSAGEMLPEGRKGYQDAHEALLSLQGVGPKVADCVCLMGLGWGEAVPVDTHVWQIAQRDYKFGKGKHSSLTKATYDAIGNKFRQLWGKDAGWAHSVLFTADLRAFSDRLTVKKDVAEVDHGEIAAVLTETQAKVKIRTSISIKRELEEDQGAIPVQSSFMEEKVTSERRTKRRRKT